MGASTRSNSAAVARPVARNSRRIKATFRRLPIRPTSAQGRRRHAASASASWLCPRVTMTTQVSWANGNRATCRLISPHHVRVPGGNSSARVNFTRSSNAATSKPAKSVSRATVWPTCPPPAISHCGRGSSGSTSTSWRRAGAGPPPCIKTAVSLRKTDREIAGSGKPVCAANACSGSQRTVTAGGVVP